MSEIVDMYDRLHVRNENERRAMDDVLMKALAAEKETKKYQEQINHIHHQAAQRIAQLVTNNHAWREVMLCYMTLKIVDT